jgi:hypothetical protein
MAVRFGAIHRPVSVSLDADNGQNNDRCGLGGLGTAEAHDPPFIGKFDDVTHQPQSSDGRHGSLNPDPVYRRRRQLSGMQG